jgi:hypothetical protein
VISYPNLWKWIGGALALVFVVVAASAWLQEHDARLKAEAAQAAQKQVIDQAQKAIDAAREDQARTASDLKAQLAAIEAEKQKPVTPAQFVVDLSKLIPNLPQPAAVVSAPAPMPSAPGALSAAAKPAQPGETTPSAAPEVVQIPAADLPSLRDYSLNCQAASARLDACDKTTADLQAQLTGTTAQLNAETRTAEIWERTAKGGTFWTRLKGGLKCVAIAGGGAALGAWANQKQPAVGAAIGVAAGEVGCRIF